MSATKRPGLDSIEPSSSDEKDFSDGNDDLDRAASLSYASHMPFSGNVEIPLQHGVSVDHSAQAQATLSSAREGLPSQTYSDSHPQGQQQHSSRNSTWNIFGGARSLGQAYEQFDPRNASEQHLVFADGDLPNSKVSCQLGDVDGRYHGTHVCFQFVRFYQFLLNASVVTRWTLFIIPILVIIWIPGILGFTAYPHGEVRSPLHTASRSKCKYIFYYRYGECA
jgi:hypothetical protein